MPKSLNMFIFYKLDSLCDYMLIEVMPRLIKFMLKSAYAL